MLRVRPLACVLVFGTLLGSAPRAAWAQPSPDAAKTEMDAGAQAARAKDWEKAATAYKRAYDAGHSAAALEGLAGALYEAKRLPEAYEAYEELLHAFETTLAYKSKTVAQARLKELAGQTGAVQITVNEAGAEVFLDDKPLGTSPLPPKHGTTGEHTLKVTKAGFSPFEKKVTLGGATVTVDVALQREKSKGHLSVKEKDGKPMRVVIDGLDVGPTPFEGDVDPGPHEILLRSSLGSSTPQRIEIERGKSVTVELATVASSARLEIKSSDPHAILFLDGKPLAEGSFAGDVAPGEHVLVVSKEGYERFEKKLSLAPNASEKVDVVLKKPGEGKVALADTTPASRGIYGGFGLAALGLPAGTGNDLETRCTNEAIGTGDCSTPMPVGGGAFGYLGYAFDPVGFEVFLGGEFDRATPKANFSGQATTAVTNPLLPGAPRVEEFTFIRTGGLAALRVRTSFEGEKLRVSIAAGFGASYKYAALIERTATSTDGKNLKDVFSPSGQTYISPAVTADASVQWRLSRSISASLGLLMWLESASFTDLRTSGDKGRFMAAPGETPRPIFTPPYLIASGAQLFLGPYLGMQFGP